jgi:Septum formation
MSVPGAAQPAAKPDGEASDTTPTDPAPDIPEATADDEAAEASEASEEPAGEDTAEYTDDGEYQDEYWEEEYERPPLSKLAVVAMITGLLALLPLALGFGIAALAVIRRTGRRGTGMALTGIYAAWIWVLVGAAAAALIYYTHGFSPRVQVRYKPSAAYSLQPGDCLNRLNDGSFSIVSCSTSHDAEVYGRFALSGTTYPGSTTIQTSVTSGCAGLLTSYVNPQYADIGFSQEYVYPDQKAWAAGERTVICEASFDSGAITGSIRK